MFRSILVPVDGSPHAEHALAEAVDLAQATNAKLTVMTAIPEIPSWVVGDGVIGAADIQALMQESERRYQGLLDSAVKQIPQSLPVTKALARGPAGPLIVKQVKSGGHDLVVMGSRGRGNITSLLLGSVSRHVLHTASVAVLIMQSDEA